jgi:hypothetical protein
MHLGKEMVDEKRIKVVYKNAEGMLADGFSKVYDPSRHVPFAKMILGRTKAGQQVGAGNNGGNGSNDEMVVGNTY